MINVALVGCGLQANWHADQIKKIPELNVVALCDIVPEKMRQYREKHFPAAAEYESYDRLIADRPGKLDAVILVTPHACHYPQAKTALQAGLHVLCEKPLVTSSEHAYDLWRTQRRTGKLLAISIQAPYSPEFQAIARLRDSGEMGKPQLIQGWLAQGWMNNTKGKWRQDPKISGGGQLYDSGAHVLNSIMWLLNSPVIEVACFYDTLGAPVDINGVAIMRFQNGAMGSVCIGGNSPGWEHSINLQTDRMVIKTAIHGWALDVTRAGRKFYPQVESSDRPGFGSPHLNFADAVEGRAAPVSPVRYGVLLSALMDAMYESADKHAPVKVRPVPTDLV